MKHSSKLLMQLCALFTAFSLCESIGLADEADEPPAAIDFNRDIRPLLSDRCFYCHGPDAVTVFLAEECNGSPIFRLFDRENLRLNW